jgi:hypothetical protein
MLVVAVASAVPPTKGHLLLVPLSQSARAVMVPRALAGGARLVDAHSLFGGIVVDGSRRRIERALHGTALLVLGGPAAGCSA